MDFFEKYFEYVGPTEAPLLYHRWSIISAVGALLSRSVWLPFGHSQIYPNQYIMLMGSPGARKSSAIGISKKLLKDLGYNRFAPDRLSKERFLMEMRPKHDEELDADLTELVFDAPSELYVVAEEFTDFVGHGGIEFMTMLTKLWDNMDCYEHPKIHGKSVVVEKPTVNIIGGNTVQGLALALPPEALGNGFMSRVIFVHSEATGKKITFPKPVSAELRKDLINHLEVMKGDIAGEFSYSPEAYNLLDRMYKEFRDVDDHRFKHYSTRRFTHLLKLCIILAALNLRTIITGEDALNANTLLHYTELRMPKSLGEFGKSKYSDTAHLILDALSHTLKPMTINELFKVVARDLSKISELSDIIKNLMASDKIQVVTIKGKQGYMPLYKEVQEWDPSLLNKSFLLEEELI
jgi:hypothetical protein